MFHTFTFKLDRPKLVCRHMRRSMSNIWEQNLAIQVVNLYAFIYHFLYSIREKYWTEIDCIVLYLFPFYCSMETNFCTTREWEFFLYKAKKLQATIAKNQGIVDPTGTETLAKLLLELKSTPVSYNKKTPLVFLACL